MRITTVVIVFFNALHTVSIQKQPLWGIPRVYWQSMATINLAPFQLCDQVYKAAFVNLIQCSISVADHAAMVRLARNELVGGKHQCNAQ